ncbi:MAG: signal peptidase II [Eubacteriaceae bacterium]
MYYYLFIFCILVFDQISKILVVNYVKPIITIPIIQNVFHLTYAENTGAAFSILSNKLPLLTIITIIFITILIIYLYTLVSKNRCFNYFSLSLTFIIGGAIGNLIDRIRLNYVIDFFDFRLINFAIFNVADCFIVIGSILLLLIIIFDESKEIHD